MMRKKSRVKKSKLYQKSRKARRARTVSRGKLREIARRLHKKYHLGEPEFHGGSPGENEV